MRSPEGCQARKTCSRSQLVSSSEAGHANRPPRGIRVRRSGLYFIPTPTGGVKLIHYEAGHYLGPADAALARRPAPSTAAARPRPTQLAGGTPAVTGVGTGTPVGAGACTSRYMPGAVGAHR